MNAKVYLRVSTAVFAIIALLHLTRLAMKWDAVFAGWTVPMWPSMVAFVVLGFLAYVGFMHSR